MTLILESGTSILRMSTSTIAAYVEDDNALGEVGNPDLWKHRVVPIKLLDGNLSPLLLLPKSY
jgi:hypothetical protein